jgi:beta-lactamase class A
MPALLCWPALARCASADPIAEYERTTGGRIGVHALNVTTGQTLTWRADERFIMCSSYKASLAGYVLARVDRGEEKLDALVPYTAQDTLGLWGPIAKENLAKGAMTVAAMCKAAVEISDGVCANMLMARSGGPAGLTAFLRSIGDTTTRVDHFEPALDRVPSGGPDDSTTPAAMASTLQKVVLGDVLSAHSKELLTRWMIGNQTTPRLRGGLPRNWRSATRPGTVAGIWLAISPSLGPILKCRSSSRSIPVEEAPPRRSSTRLLPASADLSHPHWPDIAR